MGFLGFLQDRHDQLKSPITLFLSLLYGLGPKGSGGRPTFSKATEGRAGGQGFPPEASRAHSTHGRALVPPVPVLSNCAWSGGGAVRLFSLPLPTPAQRRCPSLFPPLMGQRLPALSLSIPGRLPLSPCPTHKPGVRHRNSSAPGEGERSGPQFENCSWTGPKHDTNSARMAAPPDPSR